jgi:hypothetical protein
MENFGVANTRADPESEELELEIVLEIELAAEAEVCRLRTPRE